MSEDRKKLIEKAKEKAIQYDIVNYGG